MCVFYVFFMRLGTDFSHDFLLKIYFLASEKPNAGQNRFQKVTIFLLFFFLQHVSLTVFHLCSHRLLQSTFSIDPKWYLKDLCFRKDIH